MNVSDDDGGQGSDTATVTVSNVEPTIGAGPDVTIDEAGLFTSSGSFVDPDDEQLDRHEDYGDGSGAKRPRLNPDKSFALSHPYADNGIYTVTVKVTDPDGGVGTGTATVTVRTWTRRSPPAPTRRSPRAPPS